MTLAEQALADPTNPTTASNSQRDIAVAVVGAGFGGLGMAVALKKAGIDDILVFESNPEVGGVWWDNTYPGASCDVPSHLYSFAFDPYRNPDIRFPDQPSILAYLRGIADRHEIHPHLLLNTAITTATYSDTDGRWLLTTGNGDQYRAEAIVWAVGQLHHPYVPEIPGIDEFTGPAFHSARWDHTIDLAGRDVAVIGTGSSGAQIVGAIARTAGHVTVYQRTPAWVLPKTAARFGTMTRSAFKAVPGLHALYRQAVSRAADLVLAPVMTGGWSARPAEWVARLYLRYQIRDPRLRARLTPSYRIGEKRILIDSTFYRALAQPNVELVTDPTKRVTAKAIHTRDGARRPTDVIVYATGFRATEFLTTIEVTGRSGIDLRKQWRDGAEAYLGMAVPGFPNMFLLAGPNSFTPAGSNPEMKWHQTRYIVEAIALSQQLGAPLEVKSKTMQQYRAWLQKTMEHTVWREGVHSWFKTASGRITNPWPASVRKFAHMTARDPRNDLTPVARGRAYGTTAPDPRHPAAF